MISSEETTYQGDASQGATSQDTTPHEAVSQEFSFRLSNSALLDKVDKLRDLGVGDFIALPQLVVVGDQSSGKSSILEAILQLPFPRDSGLCTRFATNVSLRRKAQKSIVVSITPATSSSPDRAQKLRKFKRDKLTSLSGKEFLEIFQEACEVIGVSGVDEFGVAGRSTFSNDVLKIEVTGPNHENLSIIDIPGIFRSSTEGVTTDKDMLLVKEMVQSYIQDERTIILAVLPANVDIATQEIIRLAKEADPQGIRTLGVLTKPDLVDAGGEENVMDLVRGKRNKLRLGYCIVRNRGQKELSSSSAERIDKEMQLFGKAPWSSLDKDRVGISALKQRLQELLSDITRREFPKVKMQIDQRLAISKKSLEVLGPERETPDQQRRYLQQMAIDFQRLTDYAIDSYYSRDPVFSKIPALRLSTLVLDQTDSFSENMARKGHTIKFQDSEDDSNADDDGDTPEEASQVSSALDSPAEGSDIGSQGAVPSEFFELSDLFQSRVTHEPTKETDILKWIEIEYRRSRGNGLEAIGPAILPTLWQQQSRNWEGIAESCMKNIIFLVHDFIDKLLEHVCPDERTRVSLRAVLMDIIIERYKDALEHVRFITHVESSTTLTKNDNYDVNRQKIRTEELRAAVRSARHPGCKIEKGLTYVRLDAVEPMASDRFTISEIHTILKAYYKVARQRFVDNVCLQAIDHHLIRGLNSPLRIFSPHFVSDLSAETLDVITSEELGVRRARTDLRAEIKALEEGRKLVRA